MKTSPAVLLLAAALATPTAAASNDEPCGAGRSPGRHLYAFAYFYDGTADPATKRVIGNAFAIHAVALTKCDPDAECEATGQSQWRMLFATAAHVIKDVCQLQKSTPAGTIKLVVPAKPNKEGRDTVRIVIDERFCAQNAEAENYANNLFTIARDDGRATSAKTLRDDDIRKNSDQWFFSADIQTSDRDIVLPVMMGPLRKPGADSEGIPLRFSAFQNAPADDSTQVEEGVWWTRSKQDYRFTADALASVYDATGWTTLKGASGSPVLEVLANGTQVRAIGITTQFAYVGCSKAAGATRTTTSDEELTDTEDDPNALILNDLARCLNDPTTGARASGKTTSFVPVLRFPPQLRDQFIRLSVGSATPAPYSWTRSPELLAALRALVRSRQNEASLEQQQKIGEAIRLLASDIPPHEMAFMLSGLASNPRNAVSPDLLSVSGCPRIEPSFGTAR